MSRDGYERWDEQPPDPDPYDPRDGRRPRRPARADEQWLPDSQGGEPHRRHGSHRRSGDYASPASPEPGYGDPGYTGGAGYADSGYGDAGYADAGYSRPDYTEPGYPDTGYTGPAYTDPGYQPGSYGRGAGYQEGRHSGSGYRDPAPPADSRPGAAGYEPGYGAADYQNGYRDGVYPADGYGDNGYGAASTTQPGAPDPFAPKAPFPAPDDPYAAPDPYGRGTLGHTDPRGQTDPYGRTDPAGRAGYDGDTRARSSRSSSTYGGPDSYGGLGSYGGQDSYGGPAGFQTGDRYPGRDDARGQRGAGQAGYDSPAVSQYGGGYDEHDYGAAAGQDPHGQYEADYVRRGDRDERNDWRAPVDETGVTRRRERDPEDELDADSARHNGFFRGFGAPDDEVGHRPPRRRRSRAGMVALLVLVLFLGAIVGGGAYAYNWYSKRHADWTNSAGYGTVLVKVVPGEVACGPLENTLASDGVVASASAFCSAAKASGKSNLLQPGYFRLHKHMGAALAWALIINPKARVQSTVAVPDGMRVSKVIALLAAKTGIPLSQFQSALKDTSALGLPSWAKGNLEGFLWPATYNFPPGTSALAMLQTMVKQFNTEIGGMNLAAKAKAAQFTEYQVIITASLLEGEVPPQYYGKVAMVIDNRLNQVPPWKLGLDSTVAYAVNKYVYNLTQSDLNTNSRYNTTKFPGLPPGPIDSPDAAAIQAVLHPVQGDWLYFVTVNKKGTTLFTASSSQFDIWAQEATKNGV